MGLAMSPSHSHTVNGTASLLSPDGDDDSDICPVCDGECTCNTSNQNLRSLTPPRPASPSNSGPLSMEELSRQYDGATSLSFKSVKQQLKPLPPPTSHPSLKIKVSIPPSMLARRRAGTATPDSSSNASSSSHPGKSRNYEEMISADGVAGENYAFIGPSSGTATPTPSYPYPSSYHHHSTTSSTAAKPPAPRKRGRPRKIVPLPRDHSPESSRRDSTSPVHRRSNPKTNIIGRQKQSIYAQKFAKTLKAPRAPSSAAPSKPKPFQAAAVKKKAAAKQRRRIDSESSLSELSDDDDDDFGYGPASRNANNFYAAAVDSDNDLASGSFPTFVSASALSSMESGDGNSSDSSLSGFDSDLSLVKEEEDFIVSEMQEKKASEWVIRNRRQSAGLSEAEIEADSDATEDDDDDEEEVAEGMQADVEGQDEDDGEDTDARRGYFSGLVTAWSDGEESSFDADVFFANLSSASDSESSDDEAKESGGMRYDDDDGSSSDVSTEAELMHKREELENLPLELAENWDGQVVFTNGTLGGQAIIDIDFEVHASQFVADTDSSWKGGDGIPDHLMGSDSDVEMSSVDDGGYEEDAGEGDGDTTDEELVGEDDLPNERAMRMFNFPLSVSAINPLSTVSPAVTPASKRHGPHMFDFPSNRRLESPSPADILAGNLGWDSADEMDELFDNEQRGRMSGCKNDGDSTRIVGPRKGVFTPAQETRQVVIDGSKKEIPSPHPRFNRRRGRRFNTVSVYLLNWAASPPPGAHHDRHVMQ